MTVSVAALTAILSAPAPRTGVADRAGPITSIRLAVTMTVTKTVSIRLFIQTSGILNQYLTLTTIPSFPSVRYVITHDRKEYLVPESIGNPTAPAGCVLREHVA